MIGHGSAYFNMIEWFLYRSHMWRKEHDQVLSKFFVLSHPDISKEETGIKVVLVKGIDLYQQNRWIYLVVILFKCCSN